MAITRYGVDSDLSAIKAALDASGLFGAISVDENVLTINDGDDNAAIKLTQVADRTWQVSIKLATGSFHNYTAMTGVRLDYVWTTATCAVLDLRDSSNHLPIILTKTSLDKYAVVSNGNNGFQENANVKAVSGSDTDESSLNVFGFTQATRTYTTMVPFTTETGNGDASYMPGAFYMPFSSVPAGDYTRVVLNGKVYLTDGYWAVLDEDL